MKTFQIPAFYKSSIISEIKKFRKISDPRKKDLSPIFLDFGPVGFYIARHFGFCYGVENAIEISFKALSENPDKNIYLLSQMIHNPDVNKDLTERGVKFLQDTYGQQLISFDVLQANDIVIIPAFGASLEMEKILASKNVEIKKYNTTCPFVERVWKKAEQLSQEKHTIIIHGKFEHEETRATFSRSKAHSKTIVVKDLAQAELLSSFIGGKKSQTEFEAAFENKFSKGFSIESDLEKVGVINQTTMLASETAEISNFFKLKMIENFGAENISDHFADTRDTLCYATNENQEATLALLQTDADLALVVGGYNSSNTSHLVELLEQKFLSYFIDGEREIISANEIQHFNYAAQKKLSTTNFLPVKDKVKIILTSGASCPDSVVESVLLKINSFFSNLEPIEKVLGANGITS